MAVPQTDELLPGEDGPLEMRYGGEPVTPEEALGVARRWARVAATQGRQRTNLALPEEVPPLDATLIPAAYRLPPRLLMLVRAKAEMESTTVTAVVTEALTAYAASSPGSKVYYKAPKAR